MPLPFRLYRPAVQRGRSSASRRARHDAHVSTSRPFHSMNPPILIAGAASSTPQGLRESSAHDTRTRGPGLASVLSRRDEVIEPAVLDHVAASAEYLDILGTVVARITVVMMPVSRGLFLAALTHTERVEAPRTPTFGIERRGITVPMMVCRSRLLSRARPIPSGGDRFNWARIALCHPPTVVEMTVTTRAIRA